jgi:hypothetical protein
MPKKFRLKIVEEDKAQKSKKLYNQHIVLNQQSKSNKQQTNKKNILIT